MFVINEHSWSHRAGVMSACNSNEKKTNVCFHKFSSKCNNIFKVVWIDKKNCNQSGMLCKKNPEWTYTVSVKMFTPQTEMATKVYIFFIISH